MLKLSNVSFRSSVPALRIAAALAGLLGGVSAFAQSAAITASSPAALNQGNLRGATVSVTLTGTTYSASSTVSHFTLATAVPGLTVHSVSLDSSTVATLRLHYDGSDFNADATIAVVVAADGTAHNAALTTATQAVVPARWVNVSKKTVALEEDSTRGVGNNDRYDVVLESPPTATTTVTVTSDNDQVRLTRASGQTTPVASTTLTFTPQNWATAQEVLVHTAQHFSWDVGDTHDELALITHEATGGGYAATTVASRTVRVTVNDDDQTGTDYDADDDQLIEIDSLAKLNAIRWDLDGDGVPATSATTSYYAAFPNAAAGMGCPDGGDSGEAPDSCIGYELTADLDFDTDGDGSTWMEISGVVSGDSDDAYYNGGAGWDPIGNAVSPPSNYYRAVFRGNGHVVSNLFINRPQGSNVQYLGLFGVIGGTGRIESLGLRDAQVRGSYAVGGVLGGWTYGKVVGCYSTGTVNMVGPTTRNSGGLLGAAGNVSAFGAGSVVASYSIAGATSENQAGGLFAQATGASGSVAIDNSWAAGPVSGGSGLSGGLVGQGVFNGARATASYYDTEATGQMASRGGVGLSTEDMKRPTGYTGIYAYWDDYDLDGDGRIDADDDAWDFGQANQYPALKWGGHSPSTQFAAQLAGQMDTAPSYAGISASVPTNVRALTPIQAFQIPAPTGGNGTYDYTVAGLPSGLVFDEDGTGACMAARTVCGTPTAAATATVTVTAADADANTAPSDSATLTFAIAVLPTIRVTLSQTMLALQEDPGSTNANQGTYTAVLTGQPTGEVTVTPTSSNSDVTTSGALTFDAMNWNTPQQVTVTAGEDFDAVDDVAHVTHAVTGIPGVASGPRVRVAVTDDDSQALTLATASLTGSGVTEGMTATYTARLASQPTGPVVVAIASSDAAVTVDADATADGEQATLLFNATTWNMTQTVTVRAREDDDGENETVTLTHDPSGADYGAVTNVDVSFTVTDDDDKGGTLSRSSLDVQENGTAEYTLVLDTEPVGGPVSVAVGGSPTVATASPETLTFTAGNWNAPQTVTVTGVDDANTGNEIVAFTHTPTGGGYNGVSISNVNVTAVDDDVAGLKVSPVNLTVSEGGTATYTVRLNVAPTAAATVTVGGATAKVTADTDTGTPGDQTTLAFDATNWNVAQTVTVAGVADVDGEDETVVLTHAVTSTGNYASLALIRRPGVDVRVEDGQTAGVVAAPSSLTIDEGGTATYEVRLSAPPASGTTTVMVAATGAAGLTVATSTLFFDATTWNTPQTVTVTAAADHDRITDAEGALTHTVANYGAIMAGPDVPATVRNTTADHDADADGLIEVDSLAKLNAMRWDLDGDGTGNAAHTAAFPNPRGGTVCPTSVSGVACRGYELTTDLDFDTDGNGVVDGDDDYPNWLPIAPIHGGDAFQATFRGNGHVIDNLTVRRPTSPRGSTFTRGAGLFGFVAASGRIESLGVVNASVQVPIGPLAGAIAASLDGRIVACYSTGSVSAFEFAGGLVGRTIATLSGAKDDARIIASYSTAAVSTTGTGGSTGNAGGLVGGHNNGAIVASYAAGPVSAQSGPDYLGPPPGHGLSGGVATARYWVGVVRDSYWDIQATGQTSTYATSQVGVDGGDIGTGIVTMAGGQTTAQLQSPTDYDGIYANWNIDLDGDYEADDPWDFGTSSQYPRLKWGGFDPARQFAVLPEPETPAPETPVVDLAPESVSSLADLALDVGAAVQLDLGAAFRDPEGGALTYRAESSHPRVASAALRGGILVVTAHRPGEARVTATATDAGGQSASQSFAVRVGTVVSFAADASAPEGGAIRLALLASRPAPRRLEVPYVLSPAAEGASADAADHDGGAGGVAVFEEGAERTEIAIGIVDDDEVEPVRERFAVALSAPAADAGYGLGAKPSALATIEEGVCDREAAVRDALRGSLSCEEVADLSLRSSLRLAGAGVSRLRPEDLLGLSGLRLLDLSGNRLSAWPGGALEMLPNLRSLRLGGNRIGSLPESLGGQSLLADLRLPDNGLSELPPGALRGLSGLRRLDLSGNALEELPAGMFEGLAALREVRLQDNPGAPFLLTMELERTDAEAWAPGPASLSARVREGAPFPMEAVLAEPEGVALSIPAGAVRGGPATVEQDGAPLLLARLSSAPAVPDAECEQGELLRPCFEGLATAAGAPLALFKRPPTVAGLEAQALESGGDDLRVELSERFESEDALAYVAESSDESVARVRIRDGVLIVEAVGEGTATVTVVATDADGLAGTLRFEVRTTELLRSQWRGWRIILLERASDG